MMNKINHYFVVLFILLIQLMIPAHAKSGSTDCSSELSKFLKFVENDSTTLEKFVKIADELDSSHPETETPI